jgi:hypothetical protein
MEQSNNGFSCKQQRNEMSNKISTTTKTISVVIGWLATAIPNLGMWFTVHGNVATPNTAFKNICAVISLLALTAFVVSIVCDNVIFNKNKRAILALAGAVRKSKRAGRSAEWGENVQALVDRLFTADAELFRYESSELFQLLMKLDKKKPGKDDLNVWSSPDWNAFNVAVLELLCIAERQLR